MFPRLHLPLCSRAIFVSRRCQGIRFLRIQASSAIQATDVQLERPAPGTVKDHEHHIFLWAPQPEGRAETGEPDWPSKVERQVCVAHTACRTSCRFNVHGSEAQKRQCNDCSTGILGICVLMRSLAPKPFCSGHRHSGHLCLASVACIKIILQKTEMA